MNKDFQITVVNKRGEPLASGIPEPDPGPLPPSLIPTVAEADRVGDWMLRRLLPRLAKAFELLDLEDLARFPERNSGPCRFEGFTIEDLGRPGREPDRCLRLFGTFRDGWDPEYEEWNEKVISHWIDLRDLADAAWPAWKLRILESTQRYIREPEAARGV